MGSVPPVSRDALTHHLAIPKIWIENGIFKNLPSMPFSYYPMNIDLLYMVPLYFGNDTIPKYIHLCFALLTSILVYGFLKSHLNKVFAIYGVLFFLSIPVIVKLSTIVYVDLGLIFFSTAALLLLCKWSEDPLKLKKLVFSAIFCGLSLGTKYNGMISLLILSLIVPFIYLQRIRRIADEKTVRHSQIRAVKYFFLFVSISLLVFSPWMIRNFFLTGNPIYPLYEQVFNPISKTAQSDQHLDKTMQHDASGFADKVTLSHFAVRRTVYGESFLQTLTIPLRVFYEGRDDDPKYFDGQLNPFLAILPLLLLLPGKRLSPNKRFQLTILFSYSIIYLLLVYVQIDMRIRWISPITGPMVILSVFGLEKVYQFGCAAITLRGKVLHYGIVVVLCTAALIGNADYVVTLFQKTDVLSYLSRQITRDQYITKFRPEYDLIKYANQYLKDDDQILCLFIGDRIYYFDKKIQIDSGILKNALIESSSADQLQSSLSRHGISYLLFRIDLIDTWAKNNLDTGKRIIFNTFLRKNGKQIKSNDNYILFKLN